MKLSSLVKKSIIVGFIIIIVLLLLYFILNKKEYVSASVIKKSFNDTISNLEHKVIDTVKPLITRQQQPVPDQQQTTNQPQTTNQSEPETDTQQLNPEVLTKEIKSLKEKINSLTDNTSYIVKEKTEEQEKLMKLNQGYDEDIKNLNLLKETFDADMIKSNELTIKMAETNKKIREGAELISFTNNESSLLSRRLLNAKEEKDLAYTNEGQVEIDKKIADAVLFLKENSDKLAKETMTYELLKRKLKEIVKQKNRAEKDLSDNKIKYDLLKQKTVFENTEITELKDSIIMKEKLLASNKA